MAIQFTPTQANIQTGATQYNVQPNLTAARAFQGIEQGIMSGMKLQEQIKEEDFRKRQTDLQNTMAAFNEDYAKASWSQKQVMTNELESLVVTPYSEDNRWDRALNSAGVDFKSRVVANLEAEREQRARAAQAEADRRARTSIDLSYTELQLQLQDVTDTDEQATLIAQWKTDNVDVYAETNPELHARALGHYATARGYVVEQRRSIADSEIRTSVFASVQATVAATGGITVEEYKGLQADLSNLSDYEVNKAAYNSALADATLSTIRAQFNRPDYVANQEDIDLLITQLDDLVTADVQIMKSGAYLDTQDMISTMQRVVNTGELNTLNAMLYDGTVSQGVFDIKVNDLTERGLLTEEAASQQKYQKSTLVDTETQRRTVLNLLVQDDTAGIAALVQSGDLNRTTVTSSISDSLIGQHADMVSSGKYTTTEANGFALQQLQKLREAGIAPTTLPFVEDTLKSTRNGQLLSNEEVSTFITTYEMALESGYRIQDSKITADYLTLTAMIEQGVSAPNEKLFDARNNPVSFTTRQVNDTLNRAIMNDIGGGVFTEGLDQNNLDLVSRHLRPIVTDMLKAGMEADTVEDLIQKSMGAHYLRIDPSWGMDNTVWIPQTDDIQTEAQYRNIMTALDNEFKDAGNSLSYVGPLSLRDNTAGWIAIDNNGKVLPIPYEDIAFAARNQRLPN